MKKIIISFLILFLSANLYSQNSVKLNKISFFESGYNIPDKSERVYNIVFDKNSARYINTQIDLINLAYKNYDQNLNIKIVYRSLSGSVYATMNGVLNIPSDWTDCWHVEGHGWKQPGNWAADKYTAEVYIDNKFIGSESFAVGDKGKLDEILKQYTSLKFYEGGGSVPKRENRRYKTSFEKYDSRFIYYELEFVNPLYNYEDFLVTLSAKYYYPDGSLFGEAKGDFNISKEWETVYITHGYGYSDYGKWKTGTYTVELSYEGFVFASKTFTIY
jgi:hypothetical protein